MEVAQTTELRVRVHTSDNAAVSELLAEHAPRLDRLAVLRMDSGAGRTVKGVGVEHNALLTATQRFVGWCAQDTDPFHVGLRRLVAQALVAADRHARRTEQLERVATALAGLDGLDRESSALRQFQRLSEKEAAAKLTDAPASATWRCVRALQHVRLAFGDLGLDKRRGA